MTGFTLLKRYGGYDRRKRVAYDGRWWLNSSSGVGRGHHMGASRQGKEMAGESRRSLGVLEYKLNN
jgi:hypothetical protein